MIKSIAISTLEILTLVFGPLPLLLFFFKKTKKVAAGVIFIYVLGSFITDSLISYHYYVHEIINKPILSRVFTLFEVLLFSVFFIVAINKKWTNIIIGVMFVTFLVAFLQHWNAPPKKFDSIPASIGAIICIVFSLIYLYITASNLQKNITIFSSTSFWCAMGILIYMAGNLFMFITFNNFNRPDAIKLANIIFPLMNILKNIFFSVGMLQKEE